MNALKRIFAATLFVGVTTLSTFGVAYAAPTASDGAKAAVCQGVSLTQEGTDATCSDGGGKGITGVIKLAVNILSLIVGIAAVIMIMIGGLKYITSQGDSNNTASAKNTILYAIIGLAIVSFAQLIVRFTLTKTIEASSCPSGQTLQKGKCTK